MDTSRVTAGLLEAAPAVLIVALVGWSFWDFLAIPRTLIVEALATVLLGGLAGLILGVRFRIAVFRRSGLVLVGLSYLGAHVFALPLEAAPALGFLTLLIDVAVLRILGERFGPILRSRLDEETRPRVNEALRWCVLRLGAASALGFLGAALTADLALSGSLPMRSIATALILSFGLIVVVLLLAFWPSIETYLREPRPSETLIQTPK